MIRSSQQKSYYSFEHGIEVGHGHRLELRFQNCGVDELIQSNSMSYAGVSHEQRTTTARRLNLNLEYLLLTFGNFARGIDIFECLHNCGRQCGHYRRSERYLAMIYFERHTHHFVREKLLLFWPCFSACTAIISMRHYEGRSISQQT